MAIDGAVEDFIIGRRIPEGTDAEVAGAHFTGVGAFDLTRTERERIHKLLEQCQGEEGMEQVRAAYQ